MGTRMNSYLFFKVFHKIKCSKLVYCMLVIQFAIGFFILNLVVNVGSTVNKQYREILEEGRNRQYNIICSLVNGNLFDEEKFDLLSWGKKKTSPNENQNFPYTQVDFNYIVEQIGKDGVVVEGCEITLIDLGQTETKEYKIHYQSDCDVIKMSMGFQDIEEEIALGNFINPREFPYMYDKEEQILCCDDTGKEYHVHICEGEAAELWLPFELYQPYYHYKDIANITLLIKFSKKSDDISLINEKLLSIRNYLNEHHQDYKYTISNEFYDYMGKSSTAREESCIFLLIAIVFFFIIVIGLIGLFLLFMERRKHELAIALSLGTQRNYLVMEVFLEIVCISLIGYVIGTLIASRGLATGWEFATIMVYFNWKVSILLLGIPLFISIVSVLPSARIIFGLKPMEILRDL